jgi:hypothetical protein
MALFGFLKKGKAKAVAMPEPPKPPAGMQLRIELPKSGRHADDLEKTISPLGTPLFPEIPKLELPELEPAEGEKGIPPVQLEVPMLEPVPEHLPEIEEFETPAEVPEELPELESFAYEPRAKKAPLFINVGIYSEMIEQLNTTRAKLNEYASAATRVIEARARKDAAMEKWRNSLEDIERKLLAIDKILFEGG